ncbi:MAG: SDR family oxidoreductase [Myxococcota bacterium]|nr:SDR family oxidoreductase [Myxococcota bacterium]
MKRFEGKVVLITGGTTGIGLAAVKKFIDAGATVITTGRSEAGLAAARAELGDRAEVVASDAGSPEAIEALFNSVKEKHGGLDVLFLNAGIGKPLPVEASETGTIDQLFDINVKGPILAIKHAAGLFRDGGSVVINTSVANQKGMPGFGIYSASKAAVRAFVRTAAGELAPRGIRVNAVSPGPIETPIWGKMGVPAEQMDEMGQNILTQVPLGRFGKPEEVADAVLFLSSNEAGYITGSELAVDGGMAQV